MTVRHADAIDDSLQNIADTSARGQRAETGAWPAHVTIPIGGHDVPVLAGGWYDRYRSNPPLSVIAAETPDLDLSWFSGMQKEKVDIGFESYSPNFYYENSRISAVFTADIARLRGRMPAQVLREVQPLQVWPGRGLVVFTAYCYHCCDNDSYNEVAISIITNRPGKPNFGPFSLLGQSLSKDYWGYVLALPVNTELARVRGVVGYHLPKWLTTIDVTNSGQSLAFTITDSNTGKVDVVFEGKKLGKLSRDVQLVNNGFTNIDHHGCLTYGHAISRQLSHASSSSGDAVRLVLGDGRLSDCIRSLQPGKMVKYEYVPEFQSALYAPASLASLLTRL